jgi:uncharacterized protein YndB with AHSA1/START domain
VTGDDLSTVRVDQYLAHSPARVWRALTTPELLDRWLMPGDFQLKVGHRYLMHAAAFPAARFSGVVGAEVLAFEPEKMLPAPAESTHDHDRRMAHARHRPAELPAR